MAFGRLERNTGPQPMSDINMTPLIDVMLVLLVIFMITAPLMTSSLKLDLPRTDAAQPSDAPQFISVAVDPQGALALRRRSRRPAAFTSRVTDAARQNPQTEVQLRADKSRAVWACGRIDRHRAEGRPEPHRLRRRSAARRQALTALRVRRRAPAPNFSIERARASVCEGRSANWRR